MCLAALQEAMRAIGPNTQTSAELLCGFFRLYARDFDYKGGVASVRSGAQLSKNDKGWTTKERGACYKKIYTHRR